MKVPRGENRAPEDRAAALVGDPQPTYFFIIGELYMLLRVHLPGLVRHGRAAHVDDRMATGGGGGQVVLHKPPLQRPHGGDDLHGHRLQQLHPDETGTPGRVLAAQLHGGPDRAGWLDRGSGGAAVGRTDALVTVCTKSRQESSDGRGHEPQRGSDFTGLTTLLPEPKRRETDRDGGGAGHGSGSWRNHHGPEHPPTVPVFQGEQTWCRN